MSGVPATRCGYTWPPDYDVGDFPGQQSCCWRPTLSDTDRCVWHAHPEDTEEKTISALQESRQDSENKDTSTQYAQLLDGAILAGVEIGDSISFTNVALRGADLRNASFIDADFSDSALMHADLTEADLTDATIAGANLSDASLYETDLLRADLSNAELYDANFKEAYLKEGNLSDAYLLRATLNDAKLMEAELPKAHLKNAKLKGAILDNADFTSADLSGANLEGADLFGATLSKADLSNAELSDCDLQNASLNRVDCTQVQIADIDSVAVNSQTRVSGRIPLLSGFRHRPIRSDATEWGNRAQGYEKLRQVFERKGIDGQHRKLHSYQRRARAKEALRSFRLVKWTSNYLSRLLTGHGVMVTRVLFWTALGILVPWYWYGLINGWTPESMPESSLYYSVVTFVTSPPHPITGVDGHVDLLVDTVDRQRVTQAMVLFQTYMGTFLIILLGYVLGNRDSI